MYVRLAFSTAIHVDPEILIVDEALAVGDAVFANRCVRKFQELRERKITVLFVSHDLGLVKQLSDRAILLLNGRIEAEGEPKDVIDRYIGARAREAGDRGTEKGDRIRSEFPPWRWRQRNLGVQIFNARGEAPTSIAAATGHGARALPLPSREVRAHGRHPDPHPHRHGRLRHQHRASSRPASALDPGDELEVDFRLECWLTPQSYTLTVATQSADGSEPRLAGRCHCLRSSGHPRCRRSGQPESQSGMARLTVKVHPRAKRSAITGRFGEAWKLDLAAPPVDGKANEECIRFFAALAGVPKSRVSIVTGATSRLKVVDIEGVAQEILMAAIVS